MQSLKIKPRISGSEGATVITFFKAMNIPAIATGFGTEGCAHIADEYAGLNNLYNGARVLVEFLKKYKLENAEKVFQGVIGGRWNISAPLLGDCGD